MNSTSASEKIKRVLKLNSPAIGVLLILTFMALMETPLLENLRTETMFGWILLVFVPIAVLLALAQLFIWFRAFSRNSSPQLKKSVQLVFLVALMVFAGFIVLRWTL